MKSPCSVLSFFKKNRKAAGKAFAAVALTLFAIALASPVATAQKGQNVVYDVNNAFQPSSAWVDASAFCGSSGGSFQCWSANADVCAMIAQALTPSFIAAGGGVIDARGSLYLGVVAQAEQPCSTNPFASVPVANIVPITVMLPASVIDLGFTLTIPNNVRLIGQGAQTVFRKVPSQNFGAAMIVMGQAGCSPNDPDDQNACSGISVEHLQLLGDNNGSYGGIDNQYAQVSSYVNDVGITETPGNALTVELGAANSGPYTNLAISAHPEDACNQGNMNHPSCVVLNAQTAGLHGITCVGDVVTTGSNIIPGIAVNASNNSIEDVHVESYWDGIRIGDVSQGPPISNVLVSNVFTSFSAYCPNQNPPEFVTNTVHICGNSPHNPNNTFGECTNVGSIPAVSDVTVLGVTNYLDVTQNGTYPATSIQDDQTGTTIQGCSYNTPGCAGVVATGLYSLGEPEGGGTAHTRFTTSPANSSVFAGNNSTVSSTWGVGTNSGIANSTCYTPGGLYSNTGASGASDSVYICTFSGGSMIWKGVTTP